MGDTVANADLGSPIAGVLGGPTFLVWTPASNDQGLCATQTAPVLASTPVALTLNGTGGYLLNSIFVAPIPFQPIITVGTATTTGSVQYVVDDWRGNRRTFTQTKNNGAVTTAVDQSGILISRVISATFTRTDANVADTIAIGWAYSGLATGFGAVMLPCPVQLDGVGGDLLGAAIVNPGGGTFTRSFFFNPTGTSAIAKGNSLKTSSLQTVTASVPTCTVQPTSNVQWALTFAPGVILNSGSY